MSVRQRQRPRFQVDLAEPPRRGRLPFRVVVERRRKKPRFRVGPIDPSQRGVLPFRVRVVVERRRPRRRFSVMVAQRERVQRWALRLSSAASAQRERVQRWALRLSPATLGERRRLRVWALRLALACVLLAAAVGGLFFSPLLRSPTKVHPSAASSYFRDEAREIAQEKAQARRPDPPFPSLQPYVPAAGSQPPVVQAASAFVFDPDRGWILYQKDADEERAMASTTKVMTLLLAARYNFDQVVTVGPDAAALVNSDNSYMGVSTGEQLTVRDLVYGLVVASGNDAAVALADQLGGTEASFVTMMNRQARLLDLTHTVFVTPDGLDDGNRTSAHDLAVLAAVALRFPGVEQITSTRYLKIPQTATHKTYEMWNNNDLLPGGASSYPGVVGVKTGYTVEAQYCMAFAARLQGRLIVGAVLGDPSPGVRAADAHALLDWAFAQG